MRLRPSLLETERLRSLGQCRDYTRVKRLHFLQSGGEELALRGRSLVHADADENLAQERKDARDVIESGY